MTKQRGWSENKQTPDLLAFILLQELDAQPMHKQQIATNIRNSLGVSIETETIETSLEDLKNQGFIENRKSIDFDFEPSPPYQLTAQGRNALSEAEKALIVTCRELNE